jgi:hypothetical protein
MRGEVLRTLATFYPLLTGSFVMVLLNKCEKREQEE